MTIPAYGTGAFSAFRADVGFRNVKGTLDTLQTQLTTGKKATDYSGLSAAAARTSLSSRSQIATLDGYASNITDATLRIQVMSQGLNEANTITQSLRTSLAGSYTQSPIGQTTAQVSAADGFSRIVDLLNTDVAGRYLFSGRASDTEPVAPSDLILNGDASHAGLKQLIAERKSADLGADGMGRLRMTTSGTATTLGAEAAGLPFGMTVASATATGAGITATNAAGPPATATIDVAAQPQAGDAVSVVLGLPDGTQTTVTLTASSDGRNAAGTFAIGATAADTAANLSAALGSSVKTVASTTLASASALRQSTDFFAGTAANPPARVAGPPFETATGTVPGTADNTVIWYKGEDGAGSARATAPVAIGDGESVGIGARANEQPFQTLLAGLAALASESFDPSDATSQGRYEALSSRVATNAPVDGIQNVATDLAVANTTIANASDRISAGKNYLQNLVDGAENADPNEVAVRLLAAQTQLQASYQITSTISRLSLVDYL